MRALIVFITKKANRDLLTWIGGGIVVALSGVWVATTYLIERGEAKPTPANIVCAQNGSIAASGNVSGSSASTNGNVNSAEVGHQGGAPCSQESSNH